MIYKTKRKRKNKKSGNDMPKSANVKRRIQLPYDHDHVIVKVVYNAIRLYLYLIFTTHGILIIGDKKLKEKPKHKNQTLSKLIHKINFL